MTSYRREINTKFVVFWEDKGFLLATRWVDGSPREKAKAPLEGFKTKSSKMNTIEEFRKGGDHD